MKTMFEEKLVNSFHFTHFYQFGKTFIQIPGQLENRSGNGRGDFVPRESVERFFKENVPDLHPDRDDSLC